VACPIADTTSLIDAGGTSLNNLDVAAGASVVLAPKGVHLHLQNLHFQVFRGSVIPCMLTFRTFGQIEVMLYAAKPADY
jgi:copper(I)-binding protein